MRPVARITKPLPGTTVDPMYPDWMRKRYMGETDYHSRAMIWLREALQDFFRDDPSVYVGSNLVFYFQKGHPRSRRDPDVLVARGSEGKHGRRSYRVWEEGVLPCVLFELASKHTWREDIGPKRRLYAKIGIPEYFIYDPEGCYVLPTLRGFRLVNGRSVEIAQEPDGGLVSQQLGLWMVPEGSMLRLKDRTTRQPIPTRQEQVDRVQRQVDQLQLQADHLQLRADQEQLRADQEQLRADQLALELERLRGAKSHQRKKGDKKKPGTE